MMLVPVLLSALLQSTSLPSATWKERNHPDMPVFPACDLGGGPVVTTMADLPQAVSAELTRFVGPGPISDADGPFNSTDVVDGTVPQRRFLRAYLTEKAWIIWFEVGGSVAGPRTIALYRDPRSPASYPTFEARRGTMFAGDLCAASKAILAGVVTGGL
jgi:hypothetical protein